MTKLQKGIEKVLFITDYTITMISPINILLHDNTIMINSPDRLVHNT